VGLIEWVVFLTGVLSVWLTIRESLWCWPIGLLNVTLLFIMAWQGHLVADASLQVFFFGIQLYGWHQWLHGGKKQALEAGPLAEGQRLDVLRVSRAPRHVLLASAVFIAVSSYLFGRFLTVYTDAHFAYWDATQAMMSVVAQWMIARKYLENWSLWIVVNVLTIGLYCAKQWTLLMALYLIYLGLAVVGHFQWERSLRGSLSPRRVALQTVGFLLAIYLGLAAWITWAGLETHLVKSDCIIVPGARVLPDRTLGPSVQGRVDHALELYRQGWAPALIFTGGQGASGPVEAECARDYAVAHGVPAEACFLENQSHTTVENFFYAREVMRAHGWRSCLVVTDPFHTRRSVTIARRFGLDAHPAPSFLGPAWRRPGTFVYYTTREVFSWLKFGLEQLNWRDPAPESSPATSPSAPPAPGA
jgi:nicotinamide mononucleotide transporter